MFWNQTLSLSALIQLCRTLRHYLGSGLTVLDVFRNQAKQGSSRVRQVATRIVAHLEQGDTLHRALDREKAVFPVLFRSLSRVGEESGMLAEVYEDLERFYTRQQKLQREFIGQITWPVIQLGLSILVIAGLIWFLGVLAQRQGAGKDPYDPLGFGLIGTSGALTFLGIVFGFFALLVGGYLLVTRVLRQGVAFSSMLLALPVLGPCLRVLAVSRFCMAFRLTHETGMPIGRSLALSLEASGNPAFEAKSTDVKKSVGRGTDLSTSLNRTKLFPTEFEEILSVAEHSGRLSEVMQQQAKHYSEEASRRLKTVANLAGYGIWIFVGCIIIFCIFRLYSSYLTSLNQFGSIPLFFWRALLFA